MKRIIVGYLLVVTFLNAAVAQENTLTVEQIVEQANQVMYSQAEDSRAYAKMTITNRRWRTGVREFFVLH